MSGDPGIGIPPGRLDSVSSALGSDCLAGGGSMGALMRGFDWGSTPLGPVVAWPQSLRTAVSICLGTSFSMMIAWGRDLHMLYNDAYLPVLGSKKHPRALGQPLLECFPELRDILAPMFGGVMASGEAVGAVDMMFPIERHGYREETYFVFSYSPIRDESGRVGGVLTTCTETTERVIGERRLRTLRALAEAAAQATTEREAFERAAKTLEPADIPFALFYGLDETGDVARLVATSNLDAGRDASPPQIVLGREAGGAWPLGTAAARGKAVSIEDLQKRFGPLPGGPWPEPATCAVTLPIARPGQQYPYGFLVAGISPRRRLDDSYAAYLELVADQVATGISNARAREEARRRAEALAELDRAKTTFFSNVSHEFRTPLTLMLGPTEDLLAGRHGELAPGQRAQLELLRRNELRLHRLVNALLEFSRIEAGRIQAWYEPVSVADLTRQIASAFQSAIERAGLEFVVDCPDGDAKTYVDPDMWEQIVLNLLSNAFKFTFEGRISIALHELENDVRLEVRDTGVGVRPEDVPRLFERFHRVEGTRARTHEGSGIGLALVQELVRLHGGRISVESTYGKGTAFTITIPKGSAHLPSDRIGSRPTRDPMNRAATFVEEALRWLPDGPAQDSSPRLPRPVEPGHDDLGRVRSVEAAPTRESAHILIADDNADMREYLRQILGERWNVETVSQGEAALDAARARRPDLILTDVMMPVLDGFGLLRAVRADPALKQIPVIMLSARSGEDSRAIGIEAGADDYLIKPFSARELVARVQTHIKLAQANAALEVRWRDWMSIFRQAPFAISLIRMPERRYEFVNDAYVRIAGRDVTGLVFDDAYKHLSPSERDAVRKRHDEIFAGDDTVLLTDFPVRSPGGGVRYYSAALRPWFTPDGVKQGIIALSMETTEQALERLRAKQLNEQTQSSEAALRQAMALREEFVTVASHELRTPLTTLALEADSLLRSVKDAPSPGGPSGAWVRKAERIRSQTTRLAQLFDAMLDVVGSTSAEVRLDLEECDLAQVVASVVERFRAESQHASRCLQLRAEPVVGQWDRARVDRIVTQLVSNALKFGGDKPVVIGVGADQSGAQITVRDAGIGIAAGDQQRIFDRFERAAPAEHFGGLGVGLWVASELARAMGGGVRVDSRPGDGATFSVTLPRRG